MSTPAGWYPDPEDSAQDRWWNGSSWSDARQARVGVPAPPTVPYGAPYASPQGYAAPSPTHGSATTALVLGIVSIVLCGLFTGIPAMVIGRRATREIDASDGRLDGRGLAQAGFWTGLVGTAFSLLGVLFFVGVIVLGVASSTSTGSECTITYPDGTTSRC